MDPRAIMRYMGKISVTPGLHCTSRALTKWGRGKYICVSKLTIIGSDNGLSPGRHQAIIWANAGILLIEPLGKKLQWNHNRNIYIFSFKKMHLKMSSGNCRPFCLGVNVLIKASIYHPYLLSTFERVNVPPSWPDITAETCNAKPGLQLNQQV